MRRATFWLMGVNGLVWGGLAVAGALGLRSIAEQHVAGSPDRSQIVFYLGYPAAALALSLLFPLWPLRVREESVAVGALLTTLAFLPFYLFFYTGGM